MIEASQLFKDINKDVLTKIVPYFSSIQSCEAGQYLMQDADSQSDVYFLLSGRVRLSLISVEGRCVSYRDIDSNDYFGWLSAIDGGLRITSAVALEASTFQAVSAKDFHTILLSDAQIHRNFLKRVGQSVRRYTDRIQELTLYSSRERIIVELERLFKAYGNPLPIKSHEDFATWAGTTRETVSRTLNDLEKEGSLEKKDDGYFVNNSKLF